MSACLGECDNKSTCCFAQLEYNGTAAGTCTVLELPAATPDSMASGHQLHYKLVSSDPIAAFALKNTTKGNANITRTKAARSATYQPCITADWEFLLGNSSGQIGTAIEGHEQVKSPMTATQCQDFCSKLIACFAVLYTPMNGGRCLLRSGTSVSNVRSFFVVPHSV